MFYDDALDSSSNMKNGTVMGDALWQPESGQFNNALRFNGMNDYVSTPFVLNPALGIFSVLAWINGGAPGQVIISQANGANWLLAAQSEGKLMTSLSRPPGGRTPSSLLPSDFVITDGQR